MISSERVSFHSGWPHLTSRSAARSPVETMPPPQEIESANDRKGSRHTKRSKILLESICIAHTPLDVHVTAVWLHLTGAGPSVSLFAIAACATLSWANRKNQSKRPSGCGSTGSLSTAL